MKTFIWEFDKNELNNDSMLLINAPNKESALGLVHEVNEDVYQKIKDQEPEEHNCDIVADYCILGISALYVKENKPIDTPCIYRWELTSGGLLIVVASSEDDAYDYMKRSNVESQIENRTPEIFDYTAGVLILNTGKFKFFSNIKGTR